MRCMRAGGDGRGVEICDGSRHDMPTIAMDELVVELEVDNSDEGGTGGVRSFEQMRV